jgi:type IV secretory pathway TrbL component
MCAWAIFLGVLEWLDGKSPVAMIGGMFVRLGIFVYLASVWKVIIDGLGNTALEIGLKISGATAKREEVMSPSGVFGIGNAEANRVIDAKNALCDGWKACIVTFGDQILLELLVIGIWICFAILTLALIMAALTFKKHGLFAFIFLPMSQLKATAFLTESAISGVIQGAVWLAFVAMVAGFGSIIFTFMELPKEPDIADILPAFLVYSFIGVMGWQSRTFAQGIVTGTTRIGGEAMTAAARNTLSWATGAGAIAQSLHAAGHVAEGLSRKAYSTPAAQRIGQEVGHAARSAVAKVRGKPAPATAKNRTGATSGKHRGGKWDLEPTEKQKHAAKQRGVDISGMTRGRASEALETQGKMDPSWYKGL